ncbi:FAD-binding dehydrogenase [Mycobacteroides chelonae]|uniref:FAD-binding dehydrogenase n=1 Tax=Mycobacteroides chelonae TaxID=1774 RepID=UPI000991A3CE|nr:FAD-binding dehydrogenase [Mycobacteroides chelonae]
MDSTDADVVVVGAGLAGLVAAYELAKAGRTVVVVDQENAANLGGQAFWSLGVLFMVDTPEQRRLGIKDSYELALQDWMGSAAFDRAREDHWARQWAQAYVEFAAGEKRAYLRNLGLRVMPAVQWAERGSGAALGHGNSVPRAHMTWGTGPEVVRIFREPVMAAVQAGRVKFLHRHQVDDIVVENGSAVGVRGTLLQASTVPRGVVSSRNAAGTFELRAQAVLIASGGIGGNPELVGRNWPTHRLGPAPKSMVCGVPAHVDGRMLAIAEARGASIVNRDRMWHYTEGLRNWDPIWPDHGIRILPGPSSLWLDATGRRLPVPFLPGFDTLGTLAYILRTGYEHTWFILTQSIIEKEFALSGSEQNPDITGKSLRLLLSRVRKGSPGPVEAFKANGTDFVVRENLHELVEGMNAINPGPALDYAVVEREVIARDREIDNTFTKDMQIMAIRNARTYLADRLTRVATPHRLQDRGHGPMIAVRLNVLTRKTLGGLQTNLDSQVTTTGGTPFDGLYAAGEVAGFGGGGVHGYNALEGTFLGGCIFSGRAAGRAISRALL